MRMALECRNICKSFNARTVISNLNFSLNEERIHGIIGPNGAGKSTFFNLISGFTAVDSGAIHFQKETLHNKKAFEIPRMGLLRSFQISSAFNDFTVFENVLFSFITK